jgi:competence protein ComEA
MKKTHPEVVVRSARTTHAMAAVFLCAVLALYAYRHYFSEGRLPALETSSGASLTIIEVAGDTSNPGVFFFDHAPTVAEALAASGEQSVFHQVDASDASSGELTTGTLVRVQRAEDGIAVNLLQMEAEKRVLFEIPLDLNGVSEEDLVSIPGIGPGTAREIVAYRKNHGNFPNVEALKSVKGIGNKKFGEIKKWFSTGADLPQ